MSARFFFPILGNTSKQILFCIGALLALCPMIVSAQWSYSGPGSGCVDVLDPYTTGMRGNASSGAAIAITVNDVPRFALTGPNCTVRGALTIVFNMSAMRAAALAVTPIKPKNVSIAVRNGVRFEGIQDVGAAADTWPLRLPSLVVVLFTAPTGTTGGDDGDALPMDIAIGNSNSNDGGSVTWSVYNVSIGATMQTPAWNVITLIARNADGMPRGSRVVITDIAVTCELCAWTRASGSELNLYFLNISNMAASTMLREGTAVNVTGVNISVSGSASLFPALVIVDKPLTLTSDSALLIQNNTVAAIRHAPAQVRMTLLTSKHAIALNSTAQLVVRGNTVSASQGTTASSLDLYIIFLFGGGFDLSNAATVLLQENSILFTSTRTGSLSACHLYTNAATTALRHDAQLRLESARVLTEDTQQTSTAQIVILFSINTVFSFTGSSSFHCMKPVFNVSGSRNTGSLNVAPFYLLAAVLQFNDTAQFNIEGGRVAVANTTVASGTLSVLLLRNFLSPITMNAQSLLILRSFSMVVTNTTASGTSGTSLLQYLSMINTVLSVSGVARVVFDSITIQATNLRMPGGQPLEVALCGSPASSGGSALQLTERARVLIHNSSVHIRDSVVVGITRRPLATLLNTSISLRDYGSVRLCGAAAAVKDTIVNNTVFAAYSDPLRVGLAFLGSVTYLNGCEALGSTPWDLDSRCGLHLNTSMSSCSWSPATRAISTTPTATATVVLTTTLRRHSHSASLSWTRTPSASVTTSVATTATTPGGGNKTITLKLAPAVATVTRSNSEMPPTVTNASTSERNEAAGKGSQSPLGQAGNLAAIIICSIVGACLVAAAVALVCYRRRSRQAADTKPGLRLSDASMMKGDINLQPVQPDGTVDTQNDHSPSTTIHMNVSDV